MLVVFDDRDDLNDAAHEGGEVVWRPVALARIRSGEEPADAKRAVANALRETEARLARRSARGRSTAATASTSLLEAGADAFDGRASVERCVAAGLFALRFAASGGGGARSVIVATDGNGVAAPRDCGLLAGREDGVGARARREGVALHVLDYAGALCGREQRDDDDDDADDGADDATWGLSPDWAGAALACERAGGGLVTHDGRSLRRCVSKSGDGSAARRVRVVAAARADVGRSFLWRRSPLWRWRELQRWGWRLLY